MHHFLYIIILITLTNCSLVCDNEKKFSQLVSEIKEEKENIADALLEPYGDVINQFQILLDKFSEYITTARSNLNEQEKNITEISNKTNILNQKESELSDELIKLENELANIKIPEDLSIDGIKNNTDYFDDILKNVKDIENELKTWNELADNYNITNLYNNLLNIPHSVSEDLSNIEKTILDENTNTNCTNSINDDLKSVFKELATLLNFTDISKNVEELKIAAEKNRLAVNESIEVFKRLEDKEKQAEPLREIQFKLEDLLLELDEVLLDLNIDKLSDIEPRIEQTENDIENYFTKTNCFVQFVQNCRVQQPNSISEIPKCIKNYCT